MTHLCVRSWGGGRNAIALFSSFGANEAAECCPLPWTSISKASFFVSPPPVLYLSRVLCFVLFCWWWLVVLSLYIVPWSPDDFDKCLWPRKRFFPSSFPIFPPTLVPRTILLLQPPRSSLCFSSPPHALLTQMPPNSFLSSHTFSIQHPWSSGLGDGWGRVLSGAEDMGKKETPQMQAG